jgi:hypothetical protein
MLSLIRRGLVICIINCRCIWSIVNLGLELVMLLPWFEWHQVALDNKIRPWTSGLESCIIVLLKYWGVQFGPVSDSIELVLILTIFHKSTPVYEFPFYMLERNLYEPGIFNKTNRQPAANGW